MDYLENNPKNIGKYIFMKHEGTLYATTLNEYVNGQDIWESKQYYPVDTFHDLMESFKHFKEKGLNIQLDEFELKCLVHGTIHKEHDHFQQDHGLDEKDIKTYKEYIEKGEI